MPTKYHAQIGRECERLLDAAHLSGIIEVARNGMTSFSWALPQSYKSISSPLLAHGSRVRWRMDGLSTLVGALDSV